MITIVVATWDELIGPARRSATAAGLAAAVEEEYPDLDERLTSAVELADADNVHGSPAFVRLLLRETDQTAQPLDFKRAASPHAAEWLAAGTIAAVIALAAPAIFVPDYYVGLGRRLLMPWDRQPAVIPFTIATSPGDGFAARGRPLTISVQLTPNHYGVALPDSCTLVMTPAAGKPLRLRMPAAGGANAFAFRIDELKDNLQYFIEAGRIETLMHSVIAVDPVELAGGPTTTLTPPAYAKSIGAQKVDGPIDLTVLEHGRVAIDCRFDRPAQTGALIFTPAAGPDRTPQRRPLTIAADRRSGHIEFPAENAKLRLELATEHEITTQTPEQTLTVVPDRPPEFRRAAGLPDAGAVRPTDALSLDVVVADDLAVAGVEVEYRVNNNGTTRREPLAVAGIGSPVATGRATFKLAGKAREGDKLFVRLRAVDNRNMPEAKLGPNVTTFPAGDRWSELRVTAAAESVRRQEVATRRDDIDKRLRELIAGVDRTDRRTYALHQDIEKGRIKADEQTQIVSALTAEQADLAKQLNELANDAAVAGLEPVADKLLSVGEQEFRQADEGFREATAALDKSRVAPLRRADESLTAARTSSRP